DLMLVQFLYPVFFYFIVYYLVLNKKLPLLLLFTIASTYALDFLVRILKYTSLDGVHHLGFVLNKFNFYGLAIGESEFRLVSKTLSNTVSASMLGVDFVDMISSSELFFYSFTSYTYNFWCCILQPPQKNKPKT